MTCHSGSAAGFQGSAPPGGVRISGLSRTTNVLNSLNASNTTPPTQISNVSITSWIHVFQSIVDVKLVKILDLQISLQLA